MPPVEANCKNVLWKLEKCVYGLNDATRSWYFAIAEFLENMNCFRSSVDYGIFTWYDNQNLSGVLLTHVDDFLYAGTTSFIQKVIDPLCKQFEMSHQSTKAFKYIGLNIEQNIDYIEEIKSTEIFRERQKFKQSQCNSFEHDQYRKLVGHLNWVANQSRPDIAFDVCKMPHHRRCY